VDQEKNVFHVGLLAKAPSGASPEERVSLRNSGNTPERYGGEKHRPQGASSG
jgi:hypothetical protein